MDDHWIVIILNISLWDCWFIHFISHPVFNEHLLSRYYCACLLACSVTQSCLTLCNPMDCNLPGSSVHGILQARILERVAILFLWGSSQTRVWTWVTCIIGRFFTTSATWEAQYLVWYILNKEVWIHSVVVSLSCRWSFMSFPLTPAFGSAKYF